MENWLLYGNIIILSTVKYIIGASMALYYVSPLKGFLLTFVGGICGVLVFTWGGFWLRSVVSKIKLYKIPRKEKKSSKLFLWLKKNGNIEIIALLTPVILSIPVGCFLMVSLNFNKLKILIYMVFSLIFWGIIFFGAKYFFGIKDIL